MSPEWNTRRAGGSFSGQFRNQSLLPQSARGPALLRPAAFAPHLPEMHGKYSQPRNESRMDFLLLRLLPPHGQTAAADILPVPTVLCFSAPVLIISSVPFLLSRFPDFLILIPIFCNIVTQLVILYNFIPIFSIEIVVVYIAKAAVSCYTGYNTLPQ